MITIETNRLILRDYKETDLNDMHRLWSDKETMYYLDDILCNSIEDTEKYQKNSLTNSDGHYFCICDIKTGKFMGSIGYTIVETTTLGEDICCYLNTISMVTCLKQQKKLLNLLSQKMIVFV